MYFFVFKSKKKQTEIQKSDSESDSELDENKYVYTKIPNFENDFLKSQSTSLKMQKIPDEIQKEIQKLQVTIKTDNDTINKMRYDFLKELQVLREMVYRKENLGDDFEYMDIYFFSPSSELDEKTCFILNSKLKEVSTQFNSKMALLKKTNDILQRNITNFEKFNEDTPGLFSYHEVNADGIVKKLAMVDDNPRSIWQAFDKHYGHSFFLDVIREEFGLIPKVNSQIEKKFNDKLFEYQKQAAEQVSKLVERYHKEISDLRDELKLKNDVIEEMNRNHAAELEETRSEIEKAFKLKMREQEDVLKTIFHVEKEGYLRKISELELLNTELSNNKVTNRLRTRLAVFFLIYQQI